MAIDTRPSYLTENPVPEPPEAAGVVPRTLADLHDVDPTKAAEVLAGTGGGGGGEVVLRSGTRKTAESEIPPILGGGFQDFVIGWDPAPSVGPAKAWPLHTISPAEWDAYWGGEPAPGYAPYFEQGVYHLRVRGSLDSSAAITEDIWINWYMATDDQDLGFTTWLPLIEPGPSRGFEAERTLYVDTPGWLVGELLGEFGTGNVQVSVFLDILKVG